MYRKKNGIYQTLYIVTFGLTNNANTKGYEKNSNVSKKMVSTTDSIYSIGQVVKHSKFGLGTIVNYEGSGDSMRLQIKFQKVGTKWLISSYANLEII